MKSYSKVLRGIPASAASFLVSPVVVQTHGPAPPPFPGPTEEDEAEDARPTGDEGEEGAGGAARQAAESLAAVHEEAERLRTEAQGQAAETLRAAQGRARQIEAEAREQGYQEGLRAAQNAEQALLAGLQAALVDLEVARQRLAEDLEPEVVRLSVGIAEQLIRQEVALHPEIVVGVARAAISRLKGVRSLKVFAHPEDTETLSKHLGNALDERPEHLEIAADAHIGRGGCVVDSERGSVDARMESQMERISAALL